MGKRTIIVYSILVFGFSLLSLRLATIVASDKMSEASAAQSAFILDVGVGRGGIYDRDFVPLVNEKVYHAAAVLPGLEAKNAILGVVHEDNKEAVTEKLKMTMPFLCPVTTPYVYSKGVDVFSLYQRYTEDQIAVHLLGQLSPETGRGASGIELALDNYLYAKGGKISIRYPTDGLRQSLSAGKIIDTGYHAGAGVVTTIDRDIQEITELAASSIERGSVVVQDCITGNILSSVSMPTFNPNNVAADMQNPNAPFVNRSFSAYSIGSSFKTLVAATALEQGFSVDRKYDCKGFIMIGKQKINCNRLIGHGVLDMTQAMEKSCNPYFISIAMQIGGNDIAYKATQLGFGTTVEFLPNLKTKSGNVPSYEELKLPAAVANLGFGQGTLLATPVHLASMISAIANGGKYVAPRLIEGYTDDGVTFSSHTPTYFPQQVFTPSAADKVRKMMVSVVEQGSGTTAKPVVGGAGGKTSSAQSGQFINGEEVIQAWFVGFYPAQSPRYTIVVFVEGGDSGSDTGGPVFKQICDNIYDMERLSKNADNS